jgi:hypothetical protein
VSVNGSHPIYWSLPPVPKATAAIKWPQGHLLLCGELTHDRRNLKRDGDQHKAVADRLVIGETLGQEKDDRCRIDQPTRRQKPKIDGRQSRRERFGHREARIIQPMAR